ncbi:MAG: hypothetical protein AAGG07_08425 [Planctomycetota bacterium]
MSTVAEGRETGVIREIVLDAPSGGLHARDDSEPVARDVRAVLGLPVERPIVMSGHQAGLWHPGIATKLYALNAIAERRGAEPVWLIVDHDEHDAATVRVPFQSDGRITERRWAWAKRIPGVPAAGRAACAPELPDTADCEPFARDALSRAHEALVSHSNASSLADQAFAACCSLLGVQTPRVLRSSELLASGAFDAVIDALAGDLPGARSSLDRAIAEAPDAGVRGITPGSTPFWTLGAGTVRRRVLEQQLADIDRSTLAPIGVLMTAMLRAAACDLFIHGTGGGGESGYDAVGERWVKDWDGWPLPRDFAPSMVASATVRLPFEQGDPPTASEIAKARWRAHTARHSPRLLGDGEAQTKKDALVTAIKDARHEGRDPATLFREMHELLARVRDERAVALGGLQHEIDRLIAQRADAELVTDRTWSIAVHPAASLEVLRGEIETRLSEEGER